VRRRRRAGPEIRHGEHRYDLGRFGLDRETIAAAAFSWYTARAELRAAGRGIPGGELVVGMNGVTRDPSAARGNSREDGGKYSRLMRTREVRNR
jgi:hypothetical protein